MGRNDSISHSQELVNGTHHDSFHFLTLYSCKFGFNIIIQLLLVCSRSNFMIYKSHAIWILCLFNLHWFEHMYVDTAIKKGNARLKSAYKLKSGLGFHGGLSIKMEGLTDWQSVLTCLWLKFKTYIREPVRTRDSRLYLARRWMC
jgi:hypothetical protein